MCEYCEGSTEPIFSSVRYNIQCIERSPDTGLPIIEFKVDDNALWLNIGYCPICGRNLKAKQEKESLVDEYLPKKFLGATRYKHPLGIGVFSYCYNVMGGRIMAFIDKNCVIIRFDYGDNYATNQSDLYDIDREGKIEAFAPRAFDVIKRVMNYIESKEHLYIEGKNV